MHVHTVESSKSEDESPTKFDDSEPSGLLQAKKGIIHLLAISIVILLCMHCV